MNDTNKHMLSARRLANIRRRNAAERRFRAGGLFAVALAVASVLLLLTDIVSKGASAFVHTRIELPIDFSAAAAAAAAADMQSDTQWIRQVDFGALLKRNLQALYPHLESRGQQRALYGLFSSGNDLMLRDLVLDNPQLLQGTQVISLLADDDVDVFYKQGMTGEHTRLGDLQQELLQDLHARGALHSRFNADFFTRSDSREAEQAGILGALAGSFYTLLVTLLLSFPIAVASAVYLEEFAPHNRLTEFLELNINNLASVPSVIFGLLGLAVFINFFGLPRSIPLAGGLVLTLMTLPTMIISSRAAIKAVPPSVREAALGVGASAVQVVMHHVIPLAMPGMLTGAIIGMARALGETAPLLMIGMVAFIVDIPGSITDPATVLPVQIFLWADSPERTFVAKTSAAIMVLLMFLILMNSVAVWLRRKMEQRW